MGEAIVGDVALALERLVELVPESDRAAPEAAPGARVIRPTADPMSGSEAMAALADAWPAGRHRGARGALGDAGAPQPRCGSPSPGSYYFCASGGLGYGISAGVGVQLAQPDRPVVCVLGEGSAQYGITALWTRGRLQGAGHLPGPAQRGVHDPQVVRDARAGRRCARALTCPGSTWRRSPRAYGMPAREVTGREELTAALREDIAAAGRAAADPGPRSRPACGWTDAARLVSRPAGLTATAIAPPRRARADRDRAPDWVAAGTPEPLRAALECRARRRAACSAAPPTSSATPPTRAPTG